MTDLQCLITFSIGLITLIGLVISSIIFKNRLSEFQSQLLFGTIGLLYPIIIIILFLFW